MGRRIVKPAKRKTRAPGDVNEYWDRLKNLIPAEVSALYIAGSGIIPSSEQIGLAGWALFCLACTVFFMAKQSQKIEGKKESYPIDWWQVFIAAISFVIWVYALGGPFVAWGIYIGYLGTLLIMGWTFIVPYFYSGAET